jgi:hypothetical protein
MPQIIAERIRGGMNTVSTGTITRISAALLVMLAATAPAWAADNPKGHYKSYEHVFEQDVEGQGYSMVYQNVNTKTLQLKNYMHGSGTMDAATLIYSNQSSKSYWDQHKDTLVYGKSNDARRGNITFVEQNEMTYAPVAMAYGTGWYEKNPIVYNSKLKERTEGKSYQEGVSMLHQIEYASAFKKDIGVELQCIEPAPKPKSDPPSPKTGTHGYSGSTAGSGLARMKIEEEVIEGTVHIGQLFTNPDPKVRDHGWKNPLIEIDENYVGTFRITKNMEVCVKKSGASVRKDWLSCCFGGYDGMDDEDKLWGEKEIFDCTCRDVAWGAGWEDKSTARY